MSPFQVIAGGKDNPGHVCPWCGFKGATREVLEDHWTSPRGKRCARNRNVNNPRQDKYNIGVDPTEEP